MEKKTKYFVASLSGGKDSVAMVLRLIALGYPLTHVIFYDAGMEFKAIYAVIEQLRPIIEVYGAKLVVLRPETDFLFDMLIRPVRAGTEKEHYGYDWCGGCTRWRTSHKVQQIKNYLNTLEGEYIQYVGIAADEPERIDRSNSKEYPLVDWGWTEKDCLQYCYDNGIHWHEKTPRTESGVIDLYSILDRVSCWCCKNKNLKELRNMYYYLPNYWGYLKGMQSRICRPFKGDKTIFELEERFKREFEQEELAKNNLQLSLFDFMS